MADNSQERFPKISTGNCYQNDLIATVIDRVERSIIATDSLRKVITKFNAESSRQTDKMIALTRWVVILTVAMLLGLLVQIWMSFR